MNKDRLKSPSDSLIVFSVLRKESQHGDCLAEVAIRLK